MRTDSHAFAIVLGAGDGTRLSSLTAGADGRPVPKQFCSVNGGPSLLRQAIQRAERVVAAERILVVLAEAHRRWWEPELGDLPAGNLVIQPRNRGTGVGILLPLLAILERDARARLVVLPSDHYVRDEAVMSAAIGRALAATDGHSERLVLLGVSPDVPDAEYGWILPGDDMGSLFGVRRFVEKPERTVAERLRAAGGMWNAFIIAARGRALLELFERRVPGAIESPGDDPIDFSRDVLQGSESRLALLPVAPCGWTDLGTPARVAGCIERDGAPRPPGRAPVDLARALALA